MSTAPIPAHWLPATAAEMLDRAAWLRDDAAYLRRCEAAYIAKGDTWMAGKVAANAAHSDALADACAAAAQGA